MADEGVGAIRKLLGLKGRPQLVLTWIGALVTLLIFLFDIAEKLGFEQPGSQFLPAVLCAGFAWASLIQHARRWPSDIFDLLVLAPVAGAFYLLSQLWPAYTGENAPLIAVMACFVAATLAVFAGLRLAGSDRRRTIVALGVVVLVLAGPLYISLFRPQDWYLVKDTLLSEHVPEGRIGILVAPYDRDSDGKLQSNMQEALGRLLSDDKDLASRVVVLLLARRIPGYKAEGVLAFDSVDEQAAAARRIALYDNGTVVVYGGTFVTRILLVHVPMFLGEQTVVPRIDIPGAPNDVRLVYLKSAAVAGFLALEQKNCKSAEQLFQTAAQEAANVRAAVLKQDDRAEAPDPNRLWLMNSTSIACQVMAGTAVQQQVDLALERTKAILDGSESDVDTRIVAAINRGAILRNWSLHEQNQGDLAKDLAAAVESYRAVLDPVPDKADPYLVAAAFNGLGVAYEKLAETAERAQNLRRSIDAYKRTMDLLTQAASGIKPPSPGDARTLMATGQGNLGVAYFKLAESAVKQEEAVALLEMGIAMDRNAMASRAAFPALPRDALLESNLADAYLSLARFRDRTANLTVARQTLIAALDLPDATSAPAVRGEILFKLGNVDVTAGDWNDSQPTRRGIAEWACSLAVFDLASRNHQSAIVLSFLAHLSRAVVKAALISEPPPVAGCNWDAEAILQRLGSG